MESEHIMIDLPDVTFQDNPGTDWRDHDEPDPDDEELEETPEDVVMMLGFDPKDMDDEAEPEPPTQPE